MLNLFLLFLGAGDTPFDVYGLKAVNLFYIWLLFTLGAAFGIYFTIQSLISSRNLDAMGRERLHGYDAEKSIQSTKQHSCC